MSLQESPEKDPPFLIHPTGLSPSTEWCLFPMATLRNRKGVHGHVAECSATPLEPTASFTLWDN